MGLLIGTKSYTLGLRARVCFYNTQTSEPMGFSNPIQPIPIVISFYEFLVNLASLLILVNSRCFGGGYRGLGALQL